MTRISETSTINSLITMLARNRIQVDKYSQQLASGVKVSEPGDSTSSGTISALKGVLDRIESYKRGVTTAQGMLAFQDDVLGQAGDVLVRAKEVAAQGANETMDSVQRAALAEEVFQLRDQMVSLANSTYQGMHIYSGAASDVAPYGTPATYDNGSGAGLSRYVYTTNAGSGTVKSIAVGDNLTVDINTAGNQVFDNAIQGLERLGRALQGYRTEPDTGAPDGSGTAYSMPADYQEQTQDIKKAMDLLDQARQTDIEPERVSVGGRMKRVEIAQSLLEMNSTNSKEELSKMQDADIADAATRLQLAQTALEASMSVTVRALDLSILKYI
jgi:flagellar hook-associated protein 3 FlgL